MYITEESINEWKKAHNAIILAHSYQPPEIQEIGDFVGDSLGLCLEAARTDADIIIFCGVAFMAESAKLLNPGKTVILPEKDAGCPMADMVTPEKLTRMREEHPDAEVVCYVNSTAEVKALSDICCTSSNAVKIVESIDPEKEIIFIPDRNLGHWVSRQTGRKMILWPGFCPTHERFIPEEVARRKAAHPEALLAVHPECPPATIDQADFVGSTEQIYTYCGTSSKDSFLIATEEGILYRLRRDYPEKEFLAAGPNNVCKNMKKIHLSSVGKAMQKMETEIVLPDDIAAAALAPLQKMMELS